MLNQMKIVTRLAIGFALVLLGAVALGLMGTRSVTQLSAISSDILHHPFAVASGILNVKADILAAQKMTNDLVAKAATPEIDALPQQLAAVRSRIERNMSTVRERFLGNPADLDRIDQALAAWHAAREETLALAKSGHPAEALALNDGRDARLVDALFKQVGDIAAFSAAKAAELEQAAVKERDAALTHMAIMLVLIVTGGTVVAYLITRGVRQSLQTAVGAMHGLIADSSDKVLAAQAVGAGDLDREIIVAKPLHLDLALLPQDELGALMKTASDLSEVQCALDHAFLDMTKSLRLARESEAARDWLKSGRNELNFLIREEQNTVEIAEKVLAFMVSYLKAGVGALYLFDERLVKLVLTATYAGTREMKLGEHFRLGEGLIGQAAREQKIICLAEVPPGYLQIGSALGVSTPKVIVAVPLLHGNRLVGVIEIGSFREFTETELKFVELARETIAIAVAANIAHQQTVELLEQTEQQSEELRVQQEELQQSNE